MIIFVIGKISKQVVVTKTAKGGDIILSKKNAFIRMRQRWEKIIIKCATWFYITLTDVRPSEFSCSSLFCLRCDRWKFWNKTWVKMPSQWAGKPNWLRQIPCCQIRWIGLQNPIGWYSQVDIKNKYAEYKKLSLGALKSCSLQLCKSKLYAQPSQKFCLVLTANRLCIANRCKHSMGKTPP